MVPSVRRLNGVAAEHCLAEFAWWRRREIAAMTHEEATIPAVSRPSSRTELVSRSSNAGKVPWLPGLSASGVWAPVPWCWACGRLWRLVLLSGSVGGSCRLAPSSGALSPEPRVSFFFFVATSHVQSGLSVVVGFFKEGRQPKNRSLGRCLPKRTIYLDLGPAIGSSYPHVPYRLLPRLFLCSPSFRRCGVIGTVCCGSG